MRKRFVARARALFSRFALLTISSAFIATIAAPLSAQTPTQSASDASGPYNVTILEGGEGLSRRLTPQTASLGANEPWTMTSWVKPQRHQEKVVVLFAVGSSPQAARALMLVDGKLALFADGQTVETGTDVPPGRWTAIMASFDGSRAKLFVDGREVGGGEITVSAATGDIAVAPVIDRPDVEHFGGQLAELKLHKSAQDAKVAQALHTMRPDFNVIVFHEVGGHWPWQVKQWRGLQEPQDPWTLPAWHGALEPSDGKDAAAAAGTACGRRSDLGAEPLAPGRSAQGHRLRRRDFARQLRGFRLVRGHRAGHRAHHAHRPRRVPRLRLRPQQPGDSGKPGAPELLVSRELRRACLDRGQTAHADIQGHQLRRRGVDERQPRSATSAAHSSAASST